MKKAILFILFSIVSFAQVPQGMSHRGTAYNTSGVVLQNTSVSIRVRILDGSASGTVVYEETHNKTTNGTGQYNFNIGQGTPQGSYTFSGINWSTNSKFLEIGIDPANGTNYTVVGSSQLMSVPYALFSENTAKGIEVIENIATLRNKTGVDGQVVFIKKHTFDRDGGEGFFFWRAIIPANTPECNDNDGTIIRASNATPGAWIRSIEGKINVNYFGTYGNSQLTDGTRIQKAIDFAYNNQFQWGYTNAGTTVYIPTGRYIIPDKLTIKSGISIEGENMNNTILVADNDVKKDGAMIEMDGGQIVGVNISNLTLFGGVLTANPDSGPGAITKSCMYLEAKQGSSGDGGLWAAKFKNIIISQFNGHGIQLLGSGKESQVNGIDYKLPNQNIIFENVGITRQQHLSNCLLVQGMHGQLTFLNCGFDGIRYNISGENFKTTKYFNVAIESNAVQPAVIEFITSTFQYSEYGAFIKYGESITFDNCWFEFLDIGVAAAKSTSGSPSRSINILNSRFANASGFGSLWQNVRNSNKDGGGFPNGTCISVEGESEVNVQNNYLIVTYPASSANPNNFFVRNYSNDADINISGNTFLDPILSKTFGVNNKTINVTNNEISTKRYKFVKINASTNNIKEIKSRLSAGETISIKAVNTIKFDNSRNILFSKPVSVSSPFILNANEVATFIKTDIGIGPINGIFYNETWHLISVNKSY